MKENDHLSHKLQQWKVAPEIPSRFQAGVWARICSRAAARESAFWPRAFRQFLRIFSQPAYASGLILAVLGISLSMAHRHAENTNSHYRSALEARYVVSIDPLSQAALRSTP